MIRFPLIRRIWAILTPGERRNALVMLGLMIFGMALEALGVGFVVPAIAVLTDENYAAKYPMLRGLMGDGSDAARNVAVIWAMLGLVAIYLFKSLFLAYLAWNQTRFVFDVQASLSARLFSLYLRQPYTFHLRRNSAQLIRNAVGDVNVFTFHALIAALTLLSEALVLVGLGVLLLAIEPVGALMVAGVLGGAAWLSTRLSRGSLQRWGEARQLHEGMRLQHLQEGLGGVKDVKLLGRETDFLNQYQTHNLQSARAGQLQMTLQQFPRLWLELLTVAGLAVLVLTMLLQGRQIGALLPTLGLFGAAAFRLMPSANRVLGSLQSLRFGLPVVDTLYEELRLQTAGVPAESASGASSARPSKRAAFRERIEFCQVTYTYEGAAGPALQEVSLAIDRGESVGVIGTSGAGKSTMVDVLLGLLTPTSGEVRADGVDVQESLRTWQDQIGYVPQSIFLTDDTLRRNVAFGLPSAQIDEAAVWRALRAAQLEDLVKSLPDGLETLVGERGVRLSGGQRQRIGIARALYHDPVVLVLDEATSSLDTATEAEVMNAVSSLHGSKTIIIVAHRLSTVENCDRLYRLEGGRVAEAGTPQSMLRSRASA